MDDPTVLALDWETLGLALALLVASAALLVLEFFIVSMGLLLALSVACAVGSVYLAFSASDVAGWGVLSAIPLLALVLTRWGIGRMRESRLVARDSIDAGAGYHHFTESIGVTPGSEGEMVTPGRPSGRARFAGGECDVQAISASLERGQRVVVRRIDGPQVLVAAVDPSGTADEQEQGART